MSIQPSSTSRPSLSPAWRYATNILSLISVLLFSGIIFGWAPLELLLLQEGQYSELCLTTVGEVGESEGDTTTTTTCAAQMNRLNAMFTLAQFWLSFASLPVGFILDMAPKPLHFAIAGALEIGGLLLMAISQSDGAIGHDYFILGYSLLALGGCMTMLGAFPASFLLARHQAGILASISCLFDASSIIFYVFFKFFEHFSITRQELFLAWGFVAIIVYTSLVLCWTHLERQDWKTVIEQDDDDIEQEDLLVQQKGNGTSNHKDTEAAAAAAAVADESSDKTTTITTKDPHAHRIQALGLQDWNVLKQLATWEYGLAVLFASCQMLRCNFYIMTVDDYLASIGDDDAKYANLFSWILPCGIVFVPLIEATVTRLGVLNTLHTTNAIGLLFGILLWIPTLAPIQLINFGLFTGFRAYLYSTLNTFIAVTFGVTTMGRIIGFVFTTAAVVSLIQYPLAVWTTVHQHGNFLPVNIGLVGLCLFPIGASFAYDYACRRSQQQETTNNLLPLSQSANNNSMNNSSYGSISGASTPTKRQSLVEGNTAYLLSSPGSPSLATLRRSRQERS